MVENKNANFVKKRQNILSAICFSGVPHYNAYKRSKNIDNELGYFILLSTKTPKIYPHEYELKREVWGAKIKTRTLSKTSSVIDAQ